MSGLPKDVCLQCGQSRAQVAHEGTFCATVSGYETVETLDEWERHHWSDWSDSELAAWGIKPHMWDENRRTNIYDLEFPASASYCEDHGHAFPTGTDDPSNMDYGLPTTLCLRCWTDTAKETDR